MLHQLISLVRYNDYTDVANTTINMKYKLHIMRNTLKDIYTDIVCKK
jgi:hypothetical protein